MEKLKLAGNICKSICTFRSLSIHRCVRNIIPKYKGIHDDWFKFLDELEDITPEILNKVSGEEIRHVSELSMQYAKSNFKLAHDYAHFMNHEGPNLSTFIMFRGKVAPSAAAAMVCLLFGTTAYEGYLKKKYIENILGEGSHNQPQTRKYRALGMDMPAGNAV